MWLPVSSWTSWLLAVLVLVLAAAITQTLVQAWPRWAWATRALYAAMALTALALVAVTFADHVPWLRTVLVASASAVVPLLVLSPHRAGMTRGARPARCHAPTP